MAKRIVLSTDSQIREWASRLAAEIREPTSSHHFYVCPEEVSGLARQIVYMQDAIIGLVGQQGVGKSSALIELSRPTSNVAKYQPDRILFKWRSQPDLYDVFLDPNNRSYPEFVERYTNKLAYELYNRANRHGVTDDSRIQDFIGHTRQLLTLRNQPDFNPEWVKRKLYGAETILGDRIVAKSRREAWFETIASKKVILIDTPDYSKTDKRRMDGDLNEIHWLWNKLALEKRATTIIVAIQKETFHDHFFLDKMQAVELKPLSTEQILKAYTKQFGTYDPFTEDAIKLLAQMSRGIFRRFLRYITLTLDLRETKYRKTHTIDPTIVKQAVTVDHLAKAMENDLTAIFRNSREQRTLAVKIMLTLWEHKEIKQNELTTQLETEPYTISRILTTLEDTKHITHKYQGKEKIIKQLEN